MSDVNAQLFYVGETKYFHLASCTFMYFEVWCCNNMQKLWLALTFQSAVLKQLVGSNGFVSNNNTKYIASTYWLIAKLTGYPFLK